MMQPLKSVVPAIVFISFFVIPTPPATSQEYVDVETRVFQLEDRIEALTQQNERLEQQLQSLQQYRIETFGPDLAPPADESIPGCSINSGYQYCFFFEPPPFDIRFFGRLVARFTAFEGDYPRDDQFLFERVRLETEMTYAEQYALRLQADLINTPKLRDAYVEFRPTPSLRLRAGQFVVPFSCWEILQPYTNIDFADLSIALDNMCFSGRDIGVMLLGQMPDYNLRYQLALLNGPGEDKPDNNSAKDVAGRLFFLPFAKWENDTLSPLSLSVSATNGDQNTDLSTTNFKTIVETAFVDFSEGTILKGDRTRFAAALVWPLGPASVKTEWMWMWFDNLKSMDGATSEDIRFNSGFISASYLLTGERKNLRRIIPRRPFNPAARQWGAWELAARYSVFESAPELFSSGLATGTERAEEVTLGLNWYLNEFMKAILNFEHVGFKDHILVEDEIVKAEDVILIQLQFEY